MFRAVVAQVVKLVALVHPGADINALVCQQAGVFDVLALTPTRRTVEKCIGRGGVALDQADHHQRHHARPRYQHAEGAGAHQRVLIPIGPFARPDQDHPGRVDAAQVGAQC
ncbi:hypothetical protein D9M71_519780 [compost metagenome]